MRYGILGDIHSNLSALKTALARFERWQVDRIISVGDVVGYGGAPGECIDLLRDVGAIVVKGNHDAACTGELDDLCFNTYARQAVRWTRDQLEPDQLEWLRSLPLTARTDHCEVAHGTLHEPEKYEYLLGIADAGPSLDAMTTPVCFVGHSHIPIAVLRPIEAPSRIAYSPDATIDLSEAQRTIVNVGSVGQPRDEDPRLALALYDSAEQIVRLDRLEYDIERETQRILAQGLPSVLADRLWLGV
ncbi:MAG: metallophosphoesterase family protein [Planctomycetota bacterium]|jgi:diadenosine tetraphosphatase ApaH/serine/threonine PP2A family protein phosphatase